MRTIAAFFLSIGIAAIAPAAADDAPFLYTDPASAMAKGDHAIQQWINWSHAHTGQSYNAVQSLTEFDYGLTDRIQVSATLAYDWERVRLPNRTATTSSVVGVQTEALFVLAPVDKNFVGVAIAVDPTWNAQSRTIALRLLLSKYTGGFEHVLNINFENAWKKDGADGWEQSGTITLNYGLGYAIDKHWTLALEAGNAIAFSRLTTDMHFADSARSVFLGPSAEYDCSLAVFSLGVQAQLPLASGKTITHGFNDNAERWHAEFRILRAI